MMKTSNVLLAKFCDFLGDKMLNSFHVVPEEMLRILEVMKQLLSLK